MRIAELFYSIQGEGALVGVPSVFVRTSGCNLRCVYCMAERQTFLPKSEVLTIEELRSRIMNSLIAVALGFGVCCLPALRNLAAGRQLFATGSASGVTVTNGRIRSNFFFPIPLTSRNSSRE